MKVYIEAGSLKHVDNDEYFGILIEDLPDITEQCKKNRSNERGKV